MSQAEAGVASPPLAPWLADQLSRALAMPGHALLLHGASGLGQCDLASALAQAWLCEAPGRQGSEPACGTCASCQQIHSRGHTDLIVLMPEVHMLDLGWPLSEKAQKELDEKKRKPSQEIRIESVRDAVAFAELTSGRGKGKVILVYPAEAMNHASANALLKTLEEPSDGLRFVLASEAVHELLPTIRSRCQAFGMRQPNAQEADAWLAQQLPSAAAQARQVALRASGLRPWVAMNMVASGADSIWPRLPKAMQTGHVAALAGWSAAQALDAQHKLCHDLWAIKLGASPRFFSAEDLPKPPPARALAAWSEQLKSLQRVIDHPFKQDLLLEDLVQQAKVCINSRV
jgi:DNA polymerase III subunit delta'